MFTKTQTTVARLSALAVFAATAVLGARADWSPWAKIPNGRGVEVSYRQVNKLMCTWRFRNGGSSTLREFEFNYTFTPAYPAGSQLKVTRFDALEEPLKRGYTAGESSSFSAETTNCPADISVQHMEWERD